MRTLGNAGFSYEPGDVNALAAGIRLWHDDRNALHQARQKSWEWGTERFNWDVEKKELLRVVDAALT